jgi:pimeloyl-ACP methyl ester carboxylesterase
MINNLTRPQKKLHPPHWILLRGLARESAHWGKFPEALLAQFPGATVQLIDLPGVGENQHEKSPWHISGIAQSVRNKAQLSEDRECYIIAISMGAMVAMEWLKEHPTGIHGAIFMNTSLNLFSPIWERLRPQNYGRLVRIALGVPVRERERLILEMTTNLADLEALLPEWVAIAEKRPISLKTTMAQLIAAAGFAGSLEPPPRPILLLRSLADKFVGCGASEKISKAWSVPLVTHPSAGHDLPLDDAPWVAEQIARFLSNISVRAVD